MSPSWFRRAKKNREAQERLVAVRNLFTVLVAELLAGISGMFDSASKLGRPGEKPFNGRAFQDFMLRESTASRTAYRSMDFYKLASLAGDMQHNAARDISRLIILGEDAKPALRKLLTGPEPGIHELVENHLSAHWSVILEEEGWEAAEFSWQANSPISIRVK